MLFHIPQPWVISMCSGLLKGPIFFHNYYALSFPLHKFLSISLIRQFIKTKVIIILPFTLLRTSSYVQRQQLQPHNQILHSTHVSLIPKCWVWFARILYQLTRVGCLNPLSTNCSQLYICFSASLPYLKPSSCHLFIYYLILHDFYSGLSCLSHPFHGT